MSKLINKTRLQEFATGLWRKIKQRYDAAFKGVTLTDDKKLKFTKIEGADTVDVDLAAYARLQDKNNFEKDVSSNIGMTDNTLKYGRLNGNANPNRTSGHRGVTSKSFVDGYIDHIVVLADVTQEAGESSRWNVWCVTKGATRNEDRVLKKIDLTATIITQTINGVEEKVVNLPIKDVFTNETYFLVRCEGKQYKVVNVNAENQTDDVVNISEVPNETTAQIPWGTNVKDNIAVMFLVGRESIKSLSEKLDKVSSDSSTYVKHSDCTDGAGEGTKNGKVLKLDNNGKINKDVLPAIALNEFFTVTTFSESGLANIQYQNGDVIFDSTSQKRYLCINVSANTFNEKFIELNDKTGVVTAINGQNGEVTLSVVEEGDVVKIKANDTVVGTINAITEDEINTIIQNLS